MTEFFRRSAEGTAVWWPVILRCGCWVVAEVSVAAVALLNEMLKQQDATSRIGWAIFGLALLGKAAMTVRLFMDQSITQHQQRLDGAKVSAAAVERK